MSTTSRIVLRIYRVETPKGGRGPYSLPQCVGLHESHSDGYHPDPIEDGLIQMKRTEVCGFTSRSALDTWFAGWHTRLHERGFIISRYDVPKARVRFAYTQVVFRRGDLVPVRTWPMLPK